MASEPLALALSVNQAEKTAVLSRPLDLSGEFAITITLYTGITPVFEAGVAYVLTAKPNGMPTGTAYGRWELTRVSDTVATVTIDLGLAAIISAMGDAETLPVLLGIDEVGGPPLLYQTVYVNGQVAREGDVAVPTVGTAVTLEDVEVITDDLQDQIDDLLGSSLTARLTLTAPAIIGGGRVVDYLGNYYNPATATKPPLGITVGAAVLGADLTVQTDGPLTDSSWSWTPGATLYAGASGVMTQTPPTSGISAPVGQAITATQIAVRVLRPINLA